MEEGLSQLAGQQRFREVSEELLDHVGHIVGRLVLVVDVVRGVLSHLSQSLDPRLHPRLTKQAHLENQTELVSGTSWSNVGLGMTR